MNIQEQKSQLRKEYKIIRSNLSNQHIEYESDIICNNFINELLPKLLKAYKDPIFAIYLSANNEVKTDKIIEHFKQNNIKFCYPKIDEKTNEINYVKYSNSIEFATNKTYKNIKEPTSKDFVKPSILITPLLIFDKNKNRIGMGKGFFDRSISKLKGQNVQICTIGLGYHAQYHEQVLPCEKHDQSLDFIVSSHFVIS